MSGVGPQMAVIPVVDGAGVSAANPMPITGEVTGIEIAEVTVSVGETAVSAEAPFPTADAAALGAVEDVVAGIGATDDVAVIDPALAGSLIALLKGLLTEVLAVKADIATVKADIATVKSDLAAAKAAIGTAGDAAVTDPALSATVVAALKGIITNTAGA